MLQREIQVLHTNTHLANVQEMGVWLPFWKKKLSNCYTKKFRCCSTTWIVWIYVKQSDTESKEKLQFSILIPSFYMLNMGFQKNWVFYIRMNTHLLVKCLNILQKSCVSVLIRQFSMDKWVWTYTVTQHGGSLFASSSPATVLVITSLL